MYQLFMVKKKRDNSYWLPRLKNHAPDVYKRLKAGEIPSVRQACIEAGWIKPKSHLNSLKREWNGASHRERSQFIDWLIESGFPIPGTVLTPMTDILDDDGYLKPEAVNRLNAAIQKAGFMDGETVRTAPLMKAMGFSPFNTSLADALRNGDKLSQKLAEALKKWLIECEKC